MKTNKNSNTRSNFPETVAREQKLEFALEEIRQGDALVAVAAKWDIPPSTLRGRNKAFQRLEAPKALRSSGPEFEKAIASAIDDVRRGSTQRAAAIKWNLARQTLDERMNGRRTPRDRKTKNTPKSKISKEPKTPLKVMGDLFSPQTPQTAKSPRPAKPKLQTTGGSTSFIQVAISPRPSFIPP